MRASLVAVLAVAPVAASVVFLQADAQRQRADAAREEALRQTREASQRLGRFVEGLRDALAIMAEAPTVRNGDPAGCTAMLTQLKARFGDQILLSANATDGWAICNTAGIAPRDRHRRRVCQAHRARSPALRPQRRGACQGASYRRCR